MSESALVVVFGLAGTLIIVGAFSMAWIYRRLESRHYEVWDGLGQPSLFLNQSAAVQRRVGRFLWQSEYADLRDHRLSLVARFCKVIAVVVAPLIIALFVLIVSVL